MFPLEARGGVSITLQTYISIGTSYHMKTFIKLENMDSPINEYTFFIEVLKMLSLEYVQASLVWIGSGKAFAQAIDLSGFNDILFLFMGLLQLALAIGVSIVVIVVVLDILGIDILGLVKTVTRGN